MATKTPMQNDKKIKWKDVASDEENDTFSPRDLAKSKSSTMSDAEQSRRIGAGLKGFGAEKTSAPTMSDAEQSRRIKAALVPSKPAPAKKPMVSTDDGERQKRIDENNRFFQKRGVGATLKKGGSVTAKPKTKCMAKGGLTSGRGDGIASKGKTKCKYV